MLLGDLPRLAAARQPGKTALVFGDRSWTYEELDAIATRLAGGLQGAGIARGDRVALFLGNRPELVFSYYACFKLGAIAVPLNNRYKGPELAYVLGHAAARLLLLEGRLAAELAPLRQGLPALAQVVLLGEAALADSISFDRLLEGCAPAELSSPAPDDVAALMYTSGTTSHPKAVAHSHATLGATIRNQATTRAVDATEVSLTVLSICHIAGLAGQVLTTAHAGGTVVLLPGFEPGACLAAINAHRPTTLQLLPAGLADLVDHPAAAECDFSSLRCCIVGGDKVPVALHERFQQRAGLAVTETCGMTESFSYAMNPPFGEKRLGSIGLPVHGTRLRLVDEAGRDVPVGSVGEILVASEANMQGYWGDPALTEATLKEGWLATGDLACVDPDGYCWFAGRRKDIIIRGGANISPVEIEDVLEQHPAVHLACVIGIKDDHLGQVPRAYVALQHDLAEPPGADALRHFLGERLAAYKIPELILIVPDLPLGPVGKVDRQQVRQWALLAPPTGR
jgi:long-chain acyl-CoA synthetase